jgi:hypothetical protein
MANNVNSDDSVSFKELKPGDKIKFFVLDTNNVITGTVQAIANYSVAKSMQTDIASRHASMQAVRITNNTISEINIIDETFIILDVGETRPSVIAQSWINYEEGIHRLDKCADYKIVLKNCTKSEAAKALNILRANSIPCSFDPLS